MQTLSSIFYVFFASLAFAIVFNIRGIKTIFCALGSTLGWLVYCLLEGVFISDIPQYFLAAVAISAYAEVMARKYHAPVSIYLVVSLISLVPGGGIYYTMQYCIQGDISQGMRTGLHTVGIAGSVAMGVMMVSSTVRLLTHAGVLPLKKRKIKG